MKRGVSYNENKEHTDFIDTQSTLTNHCIALISDEEIDERKINILVDFINTVPRQELDFNIKIDATHIIGKNLTPLEVAVYIAQLGDQRLLQSILARADGAGLDFNVENEHGTLLRRITIFSIKTKNSDILQLILDKVDISSLNFNAKSNTNNATVLHLLMEMVGEGKIELLETLLNRGNISSLDFNAINQNGETPLWSLAYLLVGTQKYLSVLQKVIDNIDASKIDLNVQSEGITLLAILASSAAQGQIGPLTTILNKADISQLDIESKIGKGGSILLFLVLTAINGHPEFLRKFIQDHPSVANWKIDDNILNIIYHGNQDDIRQILIDMIANQQSAIIANEALSTCVTTGNAQAALACIQAGADKGSLHFPMLQALQTGYHETVVALFPHFELWGIPLSKIFGDIRIFDTFEKIENFIKDPFYFLISNQIFSEEFILNILQEKLNEHCKALVSPEGEIIEENVYHLTLFLSNVPLQKLDFNIILREGIFKGNTPLWVITFAAYRKHPMAFTEILKKLNEGERIQLNFNESPFEGKYQGRTVLWLAIKSPILQNDANLLLSILDKVDISQLDFNASAHVGKHQGETVLSLLINRLENESITLFEKILAKGQFSQLDFNAKDLNGETPLAELAFQTVSTKNSAALQLVLDNVDITKLDLSAKIEDYTVLYLITEAAASGLVEPLLTILKNSIISKLDFNYQPEQARSSAFLLLLTAMAGYPEPLRMIFPHLEISSHLVDQDTKNIIFNGSVEEIKEFLITKILNSKETLTKNLFSLICYGHTKTALACIMKGANKTILHDVLRIASLRQHKETVTTIFEHYELYGVPISSILEDKTHFNSFEKIKHFLLLEDSFSYVAKLCSGQTYLALYLLKLISEVKDYDNSLLIGDETASADSKIARAKWHFERTVQPAFEKTLLSHGEIEENAILAIERKIRLLILSTMLDQANESKILAEQMQKVTTDIAQNNIYQMQELAAQKVIDFVTQTKEALLELEDKVRMDPCIKNKEALLKLEDDVMRASCQVFTSVDRKDTAQGAWRGYNPYAPVKGEWPNLLTPPSPDTNKEVWTTPIAHEGKLDHIQAYQNLRRMIAYYYLAVVDPNDGDENTLIIRQANFIAQLSDIRHAHEVDDPSCYPGTITRIADMGAFHTLAQLPPTTKEWLVDYLKDKILNRFQEKLESLISMEQKEAFYSALTELNRETAKDMIINPSKYTYNTQCLELRGEFMQALGNPGEHLETIFQKDLFPVVQGDCVYISLILSDVAGESKIYAAISDCFNRHIDKIPTSEELAKANPFKANTHVQAHELCQILLDHILNQTPLYQNSVRQLKVLTTLLEKKVPVILENGQFEEALNGLEIENREQIFNNIKLALLNKPWWNNSAIISNPFDTKVSAISALLDRTKNLKEKDRYIASLQSLENKQKLFNLYSLPVQNAFVECDIPQGFISRFTEALVMYLSYYERWDVNLFIEECSNDVTTLDEKDKSFLRENHEFIHSRFKVLDWKEQILPSRNYLVGFDLTSNKLDPQEYNVIVEKKDISNGL